MSTTDECGNVIKDSTEDNTQGYVNDNKGYFTLHKDYLDDIVTMWMNGLRAVSINNTTKTITYVFLKNKEKPSEGVLKLTWDLDPNKISTETDEDIRTNSQWDTSIDWTDIKTAIKSKTIDDQYFWTGNSRTPIVKYDTSIKGLYFYTRDEFNRLSYNNRKAKYESWFNSLGI